ncbi:hypothetical protein ACOZB2_29655 [Pantoea endophytica]
MSVSAWCLGKIESHEKVKHAAFNGDFLTIEHVNGTIIKVLALSEKVLSLRELKCLDSQKIDFLLNINKDCLIYGDVYHFGDNNGFSIGNFGDLYRILNKGTASLYIDPESYFVVRGLKQHSNVESLTRINNRVYLINRVHYAPVRVLVLNDYDLTAESIRYSIEKFGECDAILTSNPNCRRSGNSVIAAESAGKSIYSWGEFLRVLNKECL